MLCAPHLPLAVFPRGEPPAGAVAEPDGASTAWLRAPERASTLGEARAIGESAESARILGGALREGRLDGGEGTPLTGVALLLAGSARGLRWMARDLPIVHLDPRSPADVRAGLAGLRTRWRETLVLAVGDETAELRAEVDGALRGLGFDGRARWVAVAPAGGALWAASARWRSRHLVPAWVRPEHLPTTAAGVLLAEWAGVDTVRLAAGAREVDDWSAEPVPAANPAAWLASGLRGPVALWADRAALAPLAAWASAAAAARGRVLVPGEPVGAWSTWALLGPDADAVPAASVEIRVDPADPASAGAWCALVERALDLADRRGPPSW